jgi:uncharacterized membrane protein
MDSPEEKASKRPLPLTIFELLLLACLLFSPLGGKIKDFEKELWRSAPYSQDEVSDPWGMYQIRTLVARVVMVGGLILLPVLLGVGVWRWIKGRKSEALQDYSGDE